MAFTPITITASFERPDGQPAQGQVTATLSAQLRNGTEIVDPTPITGILNDAGHLKDTSGAGPLQLVANDDVDTTPAGSTYEFVVNTDAAPVDTFTAVVPHTAAAGTIDLEELM